jgi:hypothetical protein
MRPTLTLAPLALAIATLCTSAQASPADPAAAPGSG